MKVIFGAQNHKIKSNSAITAESIVTRLIGGTSKEQLKKMESKKRGVYVEKWASPKQIRIEDNKRQPRMKASKSKHVPTTHKLLTSTPAESKIATLTRLLGTADPAVRFKKRKIPKITPTTSKISKQNSKMSNITTNSRANPEVKPLRNIIEENKNNAKNTKFRSNALREVHSNLSEKTISYKSRKDIVQTPSNCSKVTRDISDHAHWSNIFPNDRQNTTGKNLLQQYICNYEQGGKTSNENKSTDKKLGNAKQEPVYDFFIDLLESVYDEELLNTDDDPNYKTSPKTSNVKFEIDDNVAQKLYMLQQNPNRYTIKDDHEPSNQNRQLADYYNNRKRLIPPKRRRKRKIFNKSFPYIPPYAKSDEERKKRKKPNLLNILKEQLSMDYAEEEPGNMYEALLSIAKQNRKRRLYIDTSSREPSEPDGVCRFKRRNVISSSTRMPKKNSPTKEYSMNATREGYKSDTTTNEKDSTHSLEVLGFDYEEGMHLDTEFSDSDIAHKSVRNITKLNEGITTVTQNWKA